MTNPTPIEVAGAAFAAQAIIAQGVARGVADAQKPKTYNIDWDLDGSKENRRNKIMLAGCAWFVAIVSGEAVNGAFVIIAAWVALEIVALVIKAAWAKMMADAPSADDEVRQGRIEPPMTRGETR